MKDLDIIEGYKITFDWKFDINTPLLTDLEGWVYNQDFVVDGWIPQATVDTAVRHRKWFRILVVADEAKVAKDRVSTFSGQRREFRSLNPTLISTALSHWYYQLQFILECQRVEEGGFSGHHLRAPGMHDPPNWCIGARDSCLIDPTDIPVGELYDGLHLIESNPHSSNCLTEFIFTVHPDRDCMGWQYNTSFHTLDPWSSQLQPDSRVRRRLWFRSIVPNKTLYSCRRALRDYIDLHPRGTIKQGHLQRQSHYRKRWCDGMASLSDRTLSIHLQNNYQSRVEYTLVGCEVIAEISPEELGGSACGEGEGNMDLQHPFLFGLRVVGSGGKDHGLQCVLNAKSAEQREEWVAALAHQVALVNPFFWPLPFGPPIAHSVVIQGDMWVLLPYMMVPYCALMWLSRCHAL